jgi:hypothetical protein
LCEDCNIQELERAYKALRLNGDNSPSYYYPSILAASATSRKPTLYIKRLRFAGHNHNNIKLRFASSIPYAELLKRERENAEKAMSLNCGF